MERCAGCESVFSRIRLALPIPCKAKLILIRFGVLSVGEPLSASSDNDVALKTFDSYGVVAPQIWAVDIERKVIVKPKILFIFLNLLPMVRPLLSNAYPS